MSAGENKAVFLSYASQDADAARRICATLRAAGVEVWFDQSELRGGDVWDQKIRKQIRECALFVPIISANTNARQEGYFRLEWKLADRRTDLIGKSKAFLLPICIDDTRDSDADVPDSFLTVQWMRLSGDGTTAAFCARVKTLTEGGAAIGRGFAPQGQNARNTGVGGRVRRRWLVLAVSGIVALAALAVWRPWRSAPNVDSRSAARGEPLSKARQLVLQARAMQEPWSLNTRDDLRAREILLKTASELDPTDGEVWAAYAQLSWDYLFYGYDRSQARRDLVRRHAETAVKLAPGSFEALLAQANWHWYSEDAGEAERRARALVSRAPGDGRALRLLGLVLRDNNRANEAIQYFQQATMRAGGDPWAWWHLAYTLDLEKRYREMEDALDRGIAIAPIARVYDHKILWLLHGRGDLEAAAATLRQAPAAVLAEERGAFVAALVGLWREDPNFALQALDKVTTDWFEDNAYYGPKGFLVGFAHELAERPAAARSAWRGALQTVEKHRATDPTSPLLVLWQARLLAVLGDNGAAQAALRIYEEGAASGASQRSTWEEGACYYAHVHTLALLGRHTEAIKSLRARHGEKAGMATITHWTLRLDPVFRLLRAEPDFQALLADTEAKDRLVLEDGNSPQKRATPARIVGDKSIAVLPFANLSDDKDANAFFADGIHEDIITNLALIRELRVVSRTSVMGYRDTTKKIGEVARELGVTYVLEGSVRRAGNEVRVTGQLIRAATDEHLWAKSYDRELHGVFAIQAALAQEIAAALKTALSLEEKTLLTRRPTENVAAYDLYLKSRTLKADQSRAGIERQITLLQGAVELDPSFAEAWGTLATAHANLVARGWDSPAARVEKAAAAMQRALALAPEAPAVIEKLAAYHMLNGELDRAEEELEKLLRLQPRFAAGHTTRGGVYRRRGQWAQAVESYRTATELDAADSFAALALAETLARCRRWADAERAWQRVAALMPDNLGVQASLARLSYLARGSTRETGQFFSRLSARAKDSPQAIALRRAWSAIAGDFREARRLDELQPNNRDDPAAESREAVDAAAVCLALGDGAAARSRLGTLPAQLRGRLAGEPANPAIWRDLALMEAILGNKDDALRCALKATALRPEAKDALNGTGFSYSRGKVLALTGDRAAAVAELQRLLRVPCEVNVHELRTGPWFVSLRDDPAFEALLNDPKNNAPLF